MKFQSLLNKFERYTTFRIFIILLAIKLSIFLTFGFIIYFFGAKVNFSTQPFNWYMFWAKAILPSFLETFLFQYLILEFYPRAKLSLNQAIWLSAVLFGLAHYQSVFYMIYEIPMGVLYAIGYVVLKKRQAPAFLFIMGIHCFWNTMMLLT